MGIHYCIAGEKIMLLPTIVMTPRLRLRHVTFIRRSSKWTPAPNVDDDR
jgi:hypothetical protein